MDGELPAEADNSTGTLVFRETIMLDLIEIQWEIYMGRHNLIKPIFYVIFSFYLIIILNFVVFIKFANKHLIKLDTWNFINIWLNNIW